MKHAGVPRAAGAEAGYRFDFRRVDGPEFIAAAGQRFEGNPMPIQDVFAKISTPNRAVAFDHEEPEFALARHPKLAIAFAAMDKAYDQAQATISDKDQLQRFLAESKAVLVEVLSNEKLAAPGRHQAPVDIDTEISH